MAKNEKYGPLVIGIIFIVFGMIPVFAGLADNDMAPMIAGAFFCFIGIVMIILSVLIGKGVMKVSEAGTIEKVDRDPVNYTIRVSKDNPATYEYVPAKKKQDDYIQRNDSGIFRKKKKNNDSGVYRYINCPHCGAINEESNDICHSCKRRI